MNQPEGRGGKEKEGRKRKGKERKGNLAGHRICYFRLNAGNSSASTGSRWASEFSLQLITMFQLKTLNETDDHK